MKITDDYSIHWNNKRSISEPIRQHIGECKTCGKLVPEWMDDEYCSRRCKDTARRMSKQKAKK